MASGLYEYRYMLYMPIDNAQLEFHVYKQTIVQGAANERTNPNDNRKEQTINSSLINGSSMPSV